MFNIEKVFTKITGTQGERDIKRLRPRIERINAMEPRVQALSDDAMRARIAEFRKEVQEKLGDLPPGIEREVRWARRARIDEVLDPYAEETFALVREAARRTLGQRHYDVQLIGGFVLHEGKIAEMRTGEGKTLVATLPSALNALTGRGVHVVTVNDYLARRDADWMGRVHRFLGLTVGCIQNSLSDAERQVAYGCDITYGTNNEFGFDYLRDNMKFDLASMVQPGYNFAIVDEVDSILVDEARTPLIISGPSDESPDLYYKANRVIPRLTKGTEEQDKDGRKYMTGDYVVDEKTHTAVLTEEGVAKAEEILAIDNLYEMRNVETLHAVEQALKAHTLYHKDVEYVIKDGQVLIVDEFTGRILPGRRWSDGLHQAVEAKEGVRIEKENQTLATITLQNYFRMYDKLSGMTGTADTEADEFHEIYGLAVSVIPTHRPMIRIDNQDTIYRTEPEKFDAIADGVKELHEKGQPVLVGTVSIEKSERLSNLLKRRGVPHVVLNAKFHEREAEIVAQAGRAGSVTIATNMAGRGTDIILGGNPEAMAQHRAKEAENAEAFEKLKGELVEKAAAEQKSVIEKGGLFIIGTERHESRRIDNQLRGRSGRQGDPGESRFYLSLEDDLMRIFASDRLSSIMKRLGMEEGVPLEHKMVSRAIERAQKQVEARNFESRKHLLEYDDVMNKQREAIYKLRRDILEGKEGRDYVLGLRDTVVDYVLERCCPEQKDPRDWDVDGLKTDLREYFGLDLDRVGIDPSALSRRELLTALTERTEAIYDAKEGLLGGEAMRSHERYVMMQVVDQLWKDHLLAIDHLKEGIGLRGYGQKDPLVEYKKESFELFTVLKERIEDQIVKYLFRLQPVSAAEAEEAAAAEAAPPPPAPRRLPPRNVTYSHGPGTEAVETVHRNEPKVGRNDPCPCGSGKKYKKCHGAPVGVSA
jgi:preprotein translocase subunit SecA